MSTPPEPAKLVPLSATVERQKFRRFQAQFYLFGYISMLPPFVRRTHIDFRTPSTVRPFTLGVDIIFNLRGILARLLLNGCKHHAFRDTALPMLQAFLGNSILPGLISIDCGKKPAGHSQVVRLVGRLRVLFIYRCRPPPAQRGNMKTCHCHYSCIPIQCFLAPHKLCFLDIYWISCILLFWKSAILYEHPLLS